jgi:hypothetical protein
MKNGPDLDRTSVDSNKRIITKKVEENWYIQKTK